MSVQEDARFWRSYAVPVIIAIGVFVTANALWSDLERGLASYVPLAFAVYLNGSCVALFLLWRAMRARRLTHRDAGLMISGWKPSKRLFGLVLVLFFSYGAFTGIESAADRAGRDAANPAVSGGETASEETRVALPDADPPDPSWADYCFWFVFLLSASLTEVLVFICITFCLLESYLRARGMPWAVATGLAAVVASVAFGLYHYSHPKPFHDLVFFPLMPVMFLDITVFVITRNVYLTFLLHNAFAAVGFTDLQNSQYPFDHFMDPATYQNWAMMAPNLLAFIAPFLLLHALEAWRGSGATAVTDESTGPQAIPAPTNRPAAGESRSARQYVVPAAVSLGSLCVLNGLWNLPNLALSDFIDHALVVYLVGGSGVALALLWFALRDGRLSPRDVGLHITGWKPWRRLFATVLIIVVVYGLFSSPNDASSAAPAAAVEQNAADIAADAQPVTSEGPASGEADAAERTAGKSKWGDFCYWYVMLLAASLAELLVFVGIVFCMSERWLKGRGTNRFASTVLAMLLASVTFGLYHYTHAPMWWPLVFVPLMPVMFINLLLFMPTRNFYLTLMLHNSFAAFGAMSADLDPVPVDKMMPVLAAFAVPLLLLHVTERMAPGQNDSPGGD